MKICIFCGAAPGNTDNFTQMAHQLGADLAKAGIGIVYGGGNTGLMGAVAEGALSQNGEVIGIMPHYLVERERAHKGLSEFIAVDTLAERKALMEEHSDAFLTLPGGFGTLDELMEMITWWQLAQTTKPSYILNFEGYYTPLLAWFQSVENHGFLHGKLSEIVQVFDTPEALLNRLRA